MSALDTGCPRSAPTPPRYPSKNTVVIKSETSLDLSKCATILCATAAGADEENVLKAYGQQTKDAIEPELIVNSHIQAKHHPDTSREALVSK